MIDTKMEWFLAVCGGGPSKSEGQGVGIACLVANRSCGNGPIPIERNQTRLRIDGIR